MFAFWNIRECRRKNALAEVKDFCETGSVKVCMLYVKSNLKLLPLYLVLGNVGSIIMISSPLLVFQGDHGLCGKIVIEILLA